MYEALSGALGRYEALRKNMKSEAMYEALRGAKERYEALRKKYIIIVNV